MSDDLVFDARSVSFRYPGADTDAVHDVSLRVAPGEFVALLGPNGSGKSTLLRLLLGALRPGAGTIAFEGRPLHDWPREQLARRVGVVTQSEEMPFPVTVRELVAMGRYPHLGAWRTESDHDREAIRRALEWCEVAGFMHRSVLELSGGERQRVRLARALAQEASTLVLDEPTAALDMAHEMALFEMMARLADAGVTIVAVTHNINIAARYAHRLVLMDSGGTAADGVPDDVLTRSTIESVYHWPVVIRQDDSAPQVVPMRQDPKREMT
ncbi:MAG TPA: ABC transporter ATP-binding protein [Longimicrobiales bacterium]|nr:ABC transporter ATP-binding protein [Longimicrobiales bacterium]